MEELQVTGESARHGKGHQPQKSLAIDAFKTLNKIFDSRKISNTVKIRTFNESVASVFLYNSGLWTLTKKLENTVNTFQRRHLRKILGIHWHSQTGTRWISEESQTTQRKPTAHMDGTDQTWSESNRNTRLQQTKQNNRTTNTNGTWQKLFA